MLFVGFNGLVIIKLAFWNSDSLNCFTDAVDWGSVVPNNLTANLSARFSTPPAVSTLGNVINGFQNFSVCLCNYLFIYFEPLTVDIDF